MNLKRVCVFCGSSSGTNPIYTETAEELGRTLARQGLGLVYGGGNVGLMGIIADATLAAGGEVIGVIPQALVDRELAHNGVTQLHIVQSMHQRKALMADLANAFIALPGGYGTLEEFCEILTWFQLGIHAKPCGILNVKGFYDPFLTQIDRAIADGFVRSVHRSLFVVERTPESLLERMRQFQAPPLHKWVDKKES